MRGTRQSMDWLYYKILNSLPQLDNIPMEKHKYRCSE